MPKAFAAALLLAILSLPALAAPPTDEALRTATVIKPFELGRPINAPDRYHAENIDPSTLNEFIAYDRAFTRVRDLLRFAIPAEDPPTNYRYTGIGPFPIKAARRYALAFQGVSHIDAADQFTTLFCATYLRRGRSIRFDNLYGAREAHAGMPRIEQDFPVPPGADSMILWIGVSNSPNRLVAGPKLLFQSLQLLDRGPLNGTKANRSLLGVNLLPVSDFEDQPLGPYAPGNKLLGSGQGNTFEIVSADTKCLRITRAPNGYPFPYFMSRPADLDNCGVEFSYRIKGQGTIHPMIWWMTLENDWNYYAGPDTELTDEWQPVRFWRGCINADVTFAACSFAVGSPEADFCVDDLALRVVPPSP